MKRAILLIAVVALVFACFSAGCSESFELVSTVTGKLSTAIEKVTPAIEKAKDLLSSSSDDEGEAGALEGTDGQAGESEDPDGQAGESDDPDAQAGEFDDANGRAGESDDGSAQSKSGEGSGRWPFSLPSLGGAGSTSGLIDPDEGVVLVPTDDYGQGYVFYYAGEEFVAYFDAYSWRVYDSYRITDHGDIVAICQALLDEHPVYGKDWQSLRTAEDMAFEWEQHNLAYETLPEDSHWREDAKDVDLDPDDQGKTFLEMYEARTGEKLDIKGYLLGR